MDSLGQVAFSGIGEAVDREVVGTLLLVSACDGVHPSFAYRMRYVLSLFAVSFAFAVRSTFTAPSPRPSSLSRSSSASPPSDYASSRSPAFA